MARPRTKVPRILQAPVAAAMRAALSIPLIVSVDTAARAARAAARAFATSRINRKKFPRAIQNLSDAYPEWSADRVHHTAVAAYEHLFQLGVEVLYAPRLITEDGFTRHLSVRHVTRGARRLIEGGPALLITGHVGNWELVGYAVSMLGFPMHAVYRPLDLPPLDRWIRYTRQRQGLNLVSKFDVMRDIPLVLEAKQTVGFVADQSGGDRGMFVPFFGRLTSTYKSIGLMAMQYNTPMLCGFARRLRPEEPDPDALDGVVPEAVAGNPSMRYVAEVTDVFGPEDWKAQPDPLFYITARYRRALENMIRAAPEQYLWMHRMWRSRPAHERQGKPFPEALRAKLAALPWMTSEELERIVDRSGRDAVLAAAAT